MKSFDWPMQDALRQGDEEESKGTERERTHRRRQRKGERKEENRARWREEGGNTKMNEKIECESRHIIT